MKGLFKCPCRKSQWADVNPMSAVVKAPLCCGVPMKFQWIFIEEPPNAALHESKK